MSDEWIRVYAGHEEVGHLRVTETEDGPWVADLWVADGQPPTTLLRLLRDAEERYGGLELLCSIDLHNPEWKRLLSTWMRFGFVPETVVMRRGKRS